MNKLFKVRGFKSLIVFAVIISGIFISAFNSNGSSDDKTVSGINVLLFFSLLLFVIIAPAFKKRERTTFYDDH